MGDTREYVVKSTYVTVDESTRTLRDIQHSADRTARSVDGLRSAVRSVGGLFAGGYFIREGVRSLITFNSHVQDVKQQIAGMLSLATKTTFVSNLDRASQLYDDLARKAARLPGTTQEYVEMAGMLTQPLVAAGAKMKDLEDITVNTVVAAKALRVDAGAAARDVDQALRGQYHSVDVFTGKLLGSMGFAGEVGRKKFNQKSASERAALLKQAITQPQITEMAAAQGASFSGVVSTLQDTFQRTMGKVGIPLFHALTHEVENLNAWLDKNDDVVERTAKTVGGYLVTGFNTIKTAVGFVVEHADTLIKIGEVWAAVKVAGMVSGGIKGIPGSSVGGMASGLINFFKRGPGTDRFNQWGDYEYVPGVSKANSKVTMSGIAGNLGLIAQAGALGLAFGHLIDQTFHLSDTIMGVEDYKGETLDVRDETTKKFVSLSKSMDVFDDAIRRASKDLGGGTGAGSTAAGTNLKGGLDFYSRQLNAVQDFMAGRRAALTNVGFTDEELHKVFAGDPAFLNKLKSQVHDLEVRRAATVPIVDNQVAVGMAQLPKAIKDQTDAAKVNQRLMEIELSYYTQYGMFKTFGPKEFAQIVAEVNKNDQLGKQTNINQTVNVHIDQVTTKDPQRWLVQLQDVVQKKTRAPTSAKRAWESNPNK